MISAVEITFWVPDEFNCDLGQFLMPEMHASLNPDKTLVFQEYAFILFYLWNLEEVNMSSMHSILFSKTAKHIFILGQK